MKNADGQELFCRKWEPETRIRALMLLCHGFTEHSGTLTYDDFFKEFTKEGILVFAHDHVGHGKSEGDRVHVNDFSQYCRDVRQHVTEMKDKYPGLPVFIYGHSMGGTIAIRTTMIYKNLFDGVILSGAAIKLDPENTVSTLTKTIAKAVAFLFPQMEVSKFDRGLATRNEEAAKTYEKDELIWKGGIKARWYVCLYDAINSIQENPQLVDVPILIMQGDTDKFCTVDGAKFLYENCSSSDKTLKIYQGCWHELHAELEESRQQIIGDVRKWLNDRIPTSQ